MAARVRVSWVQRKAPASDEVRDGRSCNGGDDASPEAYATVPSVIPASATGTSVRSFFVIPR